MILCQSRVWAKTPEEALEIIYSNHGFGTVTLKVVRVNADGDIWWEYVISIEDRDG